MVRVQRCRERPSLDKTALLSEESSIIPPAASRVARLRNTSLDVSVFEASHLKAIHFEGKEGYKSRA